MNVEKQITIIYELAEILSRPPVSIEILPGGIADWGSSTIPQIFDAPTPDFPFLYFEGNLGIPKSVLYNLYIVAIELFSTSRHTPEHCQALSNVILLTNPAHQTVLNARRRFVQEGLLSMQRELIFIEVLFQASRDCAKQSTLWDYRRWVLGQMQDVESSHVIPFDFIEREFSIIRRACEVYPRNYHAWTHWGFVVDAIYIHLSTSEDYAQHFDILADEFITLYHWVSQHVSDHSAMHHLCNLSQLFHELKSRCPTHRIYEFPGKQSLNSFLAHHALSLIISYPSHESLWMYLRRAMTAVSVEGRKALVERLETSQSSQSTLSRRFFAWVVALNTVVKGESDKVAKV